MLYFISKCLQHFGVFNGIQIYLQTKIFDSGKINLPGLALPIFYRSKSIDIHTFREIYLRREYDLKGLINFEPQYIIDAGANIGFTSIFFHQQFPKANILSLEPDNQNFELLKKNTQSIELIKPIQKALWFKNSEVYIRDEGFGFRGFTISEGKEVIESMQYLEGTTIDTLMESNYFPYVDILKIDIEGSEKEVFNEGFEGWLPLTRCLIIELHDRMKDGCSTSVFRALSKYNFEFNIKGENLVFINKSFKI